jgi:hypothetical protein
LEEVAGHYGAVNTIIGGTAGAVNPITGVIQWE